MANFSVRPVGRRLVELKSLSVFMMDLQMNTGTMAKCPLDVVAIGSHYLLVVDEIYEKKSELRHNRFNINDMNFNKNEFKGIEKDVADSMKSNI